MLERFEVKGFKNFASSYVFDLGTAKGYSFNPECAKDGLVNKAMIYGHNGVGKSNLGLAIFDLIAHMTDKYSGQELYQHYLNALNVDGIAEFKYRFRFRCGQVEYEYGKSARDRILFESIKINGEQFAYIDRRINHQATIIAKGTESLNTDLTGSIVSLVSYIKNNAVLADNEQNRCFLAFVSFVNRMLFFRSLGFNNYIGLEQVGQMQIPQDIVEHNNLDDFERFLNESGIDCKLQAIEQGGEYNIFMKFNDRLMPFFEVASHGTRSLALFYFWLQRIQREDTVQFLFIDEFDAFYHHSLSHSVASLLKKVSAQVVLTTHNTSIMTNDLLRPDCYYLMYSDHMNSLAQVSNKELREAHNIEKMYKAGSFA